MVRGKDRWVGDKLKPPLYWIVKIPVTDTLSLGIHLLHTVIDLKLIQILYVMRTSCVALIS